MQRTAPSLEEIELAAWEDAYAAASPAARAAGIRHAFVNGALVTTASDYDILALNRTIGLEASGDALTVDRVLEVFRETGAARCMLVVPPGGEGLSMMLTERGLYHHNNWVKLVRGASSPPAARTAFRVGPLAAEHAGAFGELLRGGFDWPAAAAGLFGATVGRNGWVHYGAFDDDRLVAGGGMFLQGGSAWLGPAATHLAARGRGAQSALIVARLNHAIERGVRQFEVETAEPTPEKPVGSFRNLRRLGFEVAYLRPNWVAMLS